MGLPAPLLPLLASQTHWWRADGISALAPDVHSLPMADIANRSQYSLAADLAVVQTLAAKWKAGELERRRLRPERT